MFGSLETQKSNDPMIQKSDLQQPTKFKQFLTILALFFQILTIFFATHHYNWYWSTKFSYKTQFTQISLNFFVRIL